MEHTPGPWHIGREQDHSADRWKHNTEWSKIRGTDNGLIAKIESIHPKGKRQSKDFDVEAANARLIAAAPELLEVCKKINIAVNTAFLLKHINRRVAEEIWEILEPAIKAKGEPT